MFYSKHPRASARETAKIAFSMLLSLGFAVEPVFAAKPIRVTTPVPAAFDRCDKKGTSANDMAQLTFQPIGAADKVTVYNRDGLPIAQLNWAASFTVAVTERSLCQATTKNGIDIRSLLHGIGTISVGNKLLVAAELPATRESIKDPQGRVLPPGTEVFFGLDRLAKTGVVTPTVAYGGKTMGEGGAANLFNDRLLTKGIAGEQKTDEQIDSEKSAALAKRRPIHGVSSPNVPLEAIVEDSSLPPDTNPNAFLSAPTCTNSSNAMIMKSFWGKRKSFRNKNQTWSSSWHDGVDIAGQTGTPVLAAADGCMKLSRADVSFNRRAGYGLMMRLDHKNGLVSQYAHMSAFSPKFLEWAKTAKAGAEYCVLRGDQIGEVGQTGNCTGPHLHFGLQRDGKSVNPLDYTRATTNAELSNSCSVLAQKNSVLRAAAEVAARETEPRGQVSRTASSRDSSQSGVRP